MGQAKLRGTFEERLALAEQRNQMLAGKIAGNPELKKYARTHGMQRLSTRLLMAGMIAIAAQPPRQT